MRAAIFSSFVLLLLAAAPLPAVAQDGAPVPLTGDSATADEAMPEGYIPLPEGAEGEVPPLAGDDMVDNAPVEDTYEEAAEPAVAAIIDPMALCTEEAGVDHDGKVIASRLNACLKERHDQSESAMETAAIAAHARMKVQGKQAARTLTSSNMAFVAYRDAECVRRRDSAPNEETALQIEWACRTSMNDTRGQSLRAQ